MKLIGLTGRSGAGKGTAAAIFGKYGVPAIDSDAVYHELLAEKGDCTVALIAAFGADILGADGLVDRKKLASLVFGRPDTPDRLHILNTVTHTYVMAEIRKALPEYEARGAEAVLLDAPQLFEAGADGECDIVLGVIADDEVCLSRIMARDGLTREEAHRRLSAQHDNAYFRARCDAVIENNGTVRELELEIRRFLKEFGVRS